MLIPSELINKPEEVCKRLESRWSNIGFDAHYYEGDKVLIITALLPHMKVKLTLYREADNTNVVNEFEEMIDNKVKQLIQRGELC